MYLVKKILNLFSTVLSRSEAPCPTGAALGCLGLLAVLALFLGAAPVLAGVVEIGPETYRLDNGKPVTGMWEIAEKLAYAKDAAIVVVDPKAPVSLVQPLLKLLETLKVPTALVKKADYKILLERGVLHPTTTP
jgi:hypothetical protein